MTAPVLTGTGAAHVTGTGAGFAPHRGDERIVTCVEVGYDNPSSFAIPNGQWVDLTQHVRALSCNRGRSTELQRFEAGTLTMVLDNISGNYSVWIGSGLTVGSPIRVRISASQSAPTGATPAIRSFDPTDGGFFYAWWGFITGLGYSYSAGGEDDATCTVTAADVTSLLNRSDLVNAVFPTGGSGTGVPDPREVPQRHQGGNVEVRTGSATLIVPPLTDDGYAAIVNNGPNAIFLGDNTVTASGGMTRGVGRNAFTPEWTSPSGVSVAPGGTYIVPLPTEGVWGVSAGADQVSPADTRWDYGAGVQYGHDRFVQATDQGDIKRLFPGLYYKYDEIGPSDFGTGSFYVPSGPVVSSGPLKPVTANLLAHLQPVAESAFIDLYARPDGVVAWRPYSEVRDHAFDGTTTFGDNVPTEIPYSSFGPVYNDDNLFNDVTLTFTPDGGFSFEASDEASIATYGRRVYAPSYDVWLNEIGGTSPYTFIESNPFPAAAWVERYKDPIVHIPSIQLSLRRLTDAQRMRVLSLPIGYRVQVKHRPPSGDDLTAECHFEGIALTWEPGMKDVKAVLNLAPSRAPGAYS